MSICEKSNFIPDKYKYIQKYINTKVDIDKTVPFGFTSSVNIEGDTRSYVHGDSNLEENIKFKENSIFRLASQSKFMGSVGFLKLIDRGLVDWKTPLKDYLPEYSATNMGVIDPYIPNKYSKTLTNPFSTFKDSNILHIKHNSHPFKTGDYVSLEWSNGTLKPCSNKLPIIHGVLGFEIYNIHRIRNVSEDGYDIVLSSMFTQTGITGGFVKIKQVEEDVKRSICFSPDKMLINPKIVTHYYKLLPLKREITILDVLTHGIGWSYYSYAMLYMSFGYSSNLIKRDIQAGIWNEIGIPIGIPLTCYKCGIREWVRLASRVPLLYQPGEDWSYGPQLSILGAVIEIVDGRSVEEYMKDELWKPLKMEDTGFFMHDNDPSYHDKVNRICQLYVNMPKIVLKFMGNDILDRFPIIYEAQVCMYKGPRNLCLIDCGMYSTVNDYINFMKMLLNNGKTVNGEVVLSENMIKTISTFQTCFDVSNLATVSSYSSSLSVGITSNKSIIKREKLLKSIKWGLGVGTIKGCKNNPYVEDESDILAITWAGVLGTRFLIDFCSGVGYNVGTNVIGPPAGTFDTDLIELNYKTMSCKDYKYILTDLVL